MEEVRLDDRDRSNERNHQRFLSSDDERNSLSSYEKIGIGALVATGAAAIGYRTGAMRGLSRFVRTEYAATRSAFRETLDQRGSLRKDITSGDIKNYRENFLKSREELLEKKRIEQKNILESRDFDITRYMEQRQNLIEKEVPFHIEEGLYSQSILKEVKKSNLVNKETSEKIERGLAKGRTNILRSGKDSEVKMLLENQGIQNEEIVDLLNQVRKSSKLSISETERKNWVQGIQEKLRESTAKDIENMVERDSFFRKALLGKGHRQATVGDVLDLASREELHLPKNINRDLQDVLKYNKSFKDAVFDSNLYVNLKDGKVSGLSDYKPLDDIKKDTMEWWSHTMPGGLLHLRSIITTREARENAGFRIFKKGSVQPFLNAHMGVKPNEALNQDLIYADGQFMKLFDHNAINSNQPLEVLNPDRKMILTSSRYGSLSKMSRQLSGTMTDGSRNFLGLDTTNSKIAKLLDLGGQERDSLGIEAYSVVSKFFDKNWDRHAINKSLTQGVSNKEEFFHIQKYLSRNTESLSPRSINQLKDHLPDRFKEVLGETNFSRDDEVIDLFKRLGQDESIEKGDAFNYLFRAFDRNPNEVLSRNRPRSQTSLILGGRVRVESGVDEIKNEISREMIRQAAEVAPSGVVSPLDSHNTLRNFFKEKLSEGSILKEDFKQAERLINEQMFNQAGRNISISYDRMIEDANKLLKGSDTVSEEFQKSLRQMTKEINPLYHKHNRSSYKNQIEDEYLALGQANVFNQMKSFDGIKDLWKQVSPLTGRRNLEDVTPLSIYGSYFPAYRLQDALGSLGLGFSDASMGSPLQIWSSLFLKRGLPIVGGIEGYQYLDYMVDKSTGQGVTERWELFKAHGDIKDAEAREEAGSLDDLRKERMLKPGIEHLEAMPSLYLPYIGRTGPGNVVNSILGLATGKAPLNEREIMDVQETYQDILYGEDEVRKGRWWAFGSRTPYRGDRIIEYAPNSYRKAVSGYQYTNVDATAEEKYSHSMFPTLENPLGALSFLIGTRDPYWWEKKHYYDRPYMLTGGVFNRNTPFLGDIGNATIGQMIKPTREMHPEYWGDPEEIYDEDYQQDNRPSSPLNLRISPAGRTEYSIKSTPEDYGAYPAEAKYQAVRRVNSETGEPTGDIILTDMDSSESVYLPKRVNENYESASHVFRAAKEADENYIEVNPQDLFDPVYEYVKSHDKQKLNELQDPRGLNWQSQELITNWMEPHGVYNWLLMDEALQRDPYPGSSVIASSDEAYNYSQRFWDMELGSLIGSISEIGRRFIRRDSSQIDKYNPIRNMMPDWMPGDNYFINFKEGDPYSLIPHGNYRLPGESYESLNKLHPDETGEYGAFDKFKILADVAPWSEEYRFWRDYVTEYEEDPEVRKRVAHIKRQVSRKKDKYDFQDYLYKDAELEKEKVTVTRFLDDYTFLTKEYGDQPIRLAGVDVRASAEGVLEEYIKKGDKITIGVDSDPNQRVSDDTYGTMKAVVFRGIESLNREIIEKGDMKEMESDFSSTGVWARFTPGEISRGARWESIAHFESALNTKFLPVRTALEEYERVQIYSKEWATWEDLGIKDYGIPAIERMIGRDNTLLATVSGTLLGGVIGRFILGGGNRAKAGLILGGATGFLGNMYGKAYQGVTGGRWIPERRRIEHEINEYYDILEYMKYRGLYEKAKDELQETGFDIEGLLQKIEDKEADTKARRYELEEEKKRLYVKQPKGWEEKRSKINRDLQKIEEEWEEFEIPHEAAQVLDYKEKFETTLYGVDPYDDRMKVMQAFPYKDKWFFNDFADARTEDRERILELIPENQRRVYKALWGEGLDSRKPLRYYAEKYNIPDSDWEGWSPEYNLEDIKVKTVMKEDIDLTEFNFWNDDIERSKMVPDIPGNYDDYNFKGFKEVERNIINILEGRGLRDVRVLVKPNNGDDTHIRVDYEEQREREIEEEFKYNMNQYV